MTSEAHAEHDYVRLGVRLIVTRGDRGQVGRQVLHWTEPTVQTIENENAIAPDDCWLRLTEDDARAVYEALADHFGHSAHDTRALRRDYEAERKRVDRFIAHLTPTARTT